MMRKAMCIMCLRMLSKAQADTVDEQSFAALDVNGDGVIDKHEWDIGKIGGKTTLRCTSNTECKASGTEDGNDDISLLQVGVGLAHEQRGAIQLGRKTHTQTGIFEVKLVGPQVLSVRCPFYFCEHVFYTNWRGAGQGKHYTRFPSDKKHYNVCYYRMPQTEENPSWKPEYADGLFLGCLAQFPTFGGRADFLGWSYSPLEYYCPNLGYGGRKIGLRGSVVTPRDRALGHFANIEQRKFRPKSVVLIKHGLRGISGSSQLKFNVDITPEGWIRFDPENTANDHPNTELQLDIRWDIPLLPGFASNGCSCGFCEDGS
eukprot:TRINITY_DN6994_c0_g1_i1.p1 TRINITY_DN6994_c0_g1~~TRINITY_DN6994_c0_g1_i1.p1  ORF type:complete len:316 (-),score=30.26 TRINITY_DN6994_c0_g1_i1:68-1015(-)